MGQCWSHFLRSEHCFGNEISTCTSVTRGGSHHTLAEELFEDKAVQEFLDEGGDETNAELADEGNDAHCCLRSVQVADLMLR